MEVRLSFENYSIHSSEGLIDDLDINTIGLVYRVTNMLNEGNVVVYDNTVIKTIKELKTYLSISDSTWNRSINKDIKKYNILVKHKDSIVLNPKIAIHYDFTLTEEFVDLFGTEIIPLWYFRIKDMSLLNKYKDVIPLLEYQELEVELNPDKYYTITKQTNKRGIYILYENTEIVYIGKSLSNMNNRISQHKNDKDFNDVKCILFKNTSDINLYEPYLINKYKPKYNKDLISDGIGIELPEINLKGEINE